MKVHYYRPIQDRILEAKHIAELSRKKIDYIEITEDEARELVAHVDNASFAGIPYSGTITTYYGIPIKVGNCK